MKECAGDLGREADLAKHHPHPTKLKKRISQEALEDGLVTGQSAMWWNDGVDVVQLKVNHRPADIG